MVTPPKYSKSFSLAVLGANGIVNREHNTAQYHGSIWRIRKEFLGLHGIYVDLLW